MLNSDLFWNIIICISTTIEWLVFRFIIDELNEREKNKLTIDIKLIRNRNIKYQRSNDKKIESNR